ncbi:hypothetical protein MMC32_005134 [Xylographa parallela]|nr:hypothetical protein [Xylographa parallela]
MPKRGVRLLSLDGGGIRGLSELIVIEEIMFRIQGREQLEEVPLPADYFDLIGGTSTGGIIAILFGRLRLSAAQAIKAYETLVGKVFSEKKAKGKDGTFKASKLEEAIKNVVQDSLKNMDARMYEEKERASDRCRAFVCALGTSDVTHAAGPTLFRSYNVAKNREYNCTIWEAARATSAAPTFFKRIKIGPLGSGIEYVDAGLGCNNPIKQVVAEAARIYGDDAQVACIVSIGTGQSGSVGLAKPDVFEKWLPRNLIEVLKQITTDSGKTAEEMALKYKNIPGIYHRLDVDRGLQSISLDEWKSLGEVREHTKNYMRMEHIDKRIDIIVDALLGCSSQQTCEAGRLVGCITPTTYACARESSDLQAAGLGRKQTPFMVPFSQDNHFVAREDIISDIDRILETEQRVALTGIGGVGKSQIAIEYCYRYRSKYPDRSILWVHASTFERFDQAYKDIGRKLKLPGWNDTKTNMLQAVSDWLTDEDHGRWLIVLDNADDVDIFFSPQKVFIEGTSVDQYASPLCMYLPQGSMGSILVTSRNRQAAFRLTDRIEHVIDILPMDQDDAKLLLCKRLPNDNSSEDDTIALIETLERLPLAITQAAAYISVRGKIMTIAKYTAYVRQNEGILFADMGDLRRDPSVPNSVLISWQMSFDQIRRTHPRAAELLSLASVLDRQNIPGFLFDKNENRLDFEDALAPLIDFALITFEGGNECFGMHRLVQLATRNWMQIHDEITKWQEEAIILLSESFTNGEYENWEICTVLLPHAEVVLGYQYSKQQHFLRQADVLDDIASYLLVQGRFDMALNRSQRALSTRRQLLSEEDVPMAGSMALIAWSLLGQGKYEEAEAMHRKSLLLASEILGTEHPVTLTSMDNLVCALNYQGKVEEAEAMARQTLFLRSVVPRTEHPSTLIKAETVLQRTLPPNETALGMEHPNTLKNVWLLAYLLHGQRRYQEASIFYQKVSTGLQKRLGHGHPDTVKCLKDYNLMIEEMKQDDPNGESPRSQVAVRNR